MKNYYIFVIDTEEYAGNFEREMCAYLTGRIGDCGVGDNMAELYKKEVKKEDFFDNVIDMPDDDNGCMRPAAIYPTPGWFGHGMGGHFRDGQEKEALKDYVECVTKHYGNTCYHVYLREWRKGPIARQSYESVGWTEEKLIEVCEEQEKQIDKAKKLKKVKKYPAYLSVAIFFREKPSDDQISLMKERAYKFAEAKRKDDSYNRNFKLNITGFRLIKETSKSQEVSV